MNLKFCFDVFLFLLVLLLASSKIHFCEMLIWLRSFFMPSFMSSFILAMISDFLLDIPNGIGEEMDGSRPSAYELIIMGMLERLGSRRWLCYSPEVTSISENSSLATR